jgi:NitT/TauT family transport system ATP-binding protein
MREADMNRSSLVEFHSVSKCFDERRGDVIRDLTFDLRDGEFFCLLGPSGCGKTTVLNLLAGFEEPSGGAIYINGRPVVGPGRDRGVIFQGDDALFGWLTAVENVEFGLKMNGMRAGERRDRAQRFIELVGLHGHEHQFPHELSGGMKQRIQIARVLANEPRIILMDEPFAALDAQTRKTMQRELVRIWSETRTTILFITHDIDEANILADRLGLMSAGPGARIRDILTISLPRPRDREAAGFHEYYGHCNRIIEEEAQRLSIQVTFEVV